MVFCGPASVSCQSFPFLSFSVSMFVHFSLRKEDITTRNCRTRAALLFVLGQSDCAAAFESFSRAEHSEEAVLCWNAIRVFKRLAAVSDPAAHAVHAAILKAVSGLVPFGARCCHSLRVFLCSGHGLRFFIVFAMYVQHFLDDCPHEVSVPSALKVAVLSSDVRPGMFDDVQAVLEKEMAGDILPRFIKSPAWTAVLHPVSPPQTPEVPHRQVAVASPVHVGTDPGPIHMYALIYLIDTALCIVSVGW
jgi:hypothetical protein